MPPRRAGHGANAANASRAAREGETPSPFSRAVAERNCARASAAATPPPRAGVPGRRRGAVVRRDQLQQVGLVVARAPERGLARELARANLVRGAKDHAATAASAEEAAAREPGRGDANASRREPPPRERRRRVVLEASGPRAAPSLGTWGRRARTPRRSPEPHARPRRTRRAASSRGGSCPHAAAAAAAARVGRPARARRRGEAPPPRQRRRAGRRAGGTRARCVSAASRSRRRGCAT